VAHQWSHLGLVVFPGGTQVRLYLNGDRIQTWNAAAGQRLFRMLDPAATPGPGLMYQLYAGQVEGQSSGGLHGWIDELKVFAENPNPEVICNHARGTLVKVPGTPRYCYHDYASEPGAHLGNLPPGVTSLRAQLLFPKGPLVWNQSRPDSRDNNFCLSCHVDTHFTPSLRVEALQELPLVPMADDPRRQPLHPPRLISGHIPADHYGPGLPGQSVIAVPEGELQDQWVFPD